MSVTKAKQLENLEQGYLKVCQQLTWFNYFVDYIQRSDYKAYNYGCEYADKMEKEELEDEL